MNKQKLGEAYTGAWRDAGFTLLELLVAFTVIGFLVGGLIGVLSRTSQTDRVGSSTAEAQQNARQALDLVLRDLRASGYGIGDPNQLPIEVASEYRVTFVIDQDGDGAIGLGERITYFLDDNASDALVVDTPNPSDYVLRRVISSAGDTLAVPAAGAGDIVAFGLTQFHQDSNTHPLEGATASWNVRLFNYLDDARNSVLGTAADPAGSKYGRTVPLDVLNGTSGTLRAISVDLVVEGQHRNTNSGAYPRVRVSGTINPRNLNFASHGLFAAGVGEDDPGEDPPDDTPPGDDPPVDEDPPVEDPEQELPPMEPPIRIPSESVVSLLVMDMNERDSQEGSDVLIDGQNDWDILVGTDAGGTNDLNVWFAGLPDRYSSGRIYHSVRAYSGNTPNNLNDLAGGNIDYSAAEYPDVVAAVSVNDQSGGFVTWLNEYASHPGWVGTGHPSTVPSAYYSDNSGRGQAVALGDVNRDGSLDVVLGTRTGDLAGALEVWLNDGYGYFSHLTTLEAAGEVNAVVVGDFSGDGYLDIAAGTKTHNNERDGKIEVWVSSGGVSFTRRNVWDSGGKVNALAAGHMNADSDLDLVAGTKDRNRSGEVELWIGNGSGDLALGDVVGADEEVLSVALGPLDLGNASLDIVAGTAGHTVQAWFCDRDADSLSDIIPSYESWADANAGGAVRDIAVRKVEATRNDPETDLLHDIILGTAVNANSGEIVIYLNPYVWTINQ